MKVLRKFNAEELDIIKKLKTLDDDIEQYNIALNEAYDGIPFTYDNVPDYDPDEERRFYKNIEITNLPYVHGEFEIFDSKFYQKVLNLQESANYPETKTSIYTIKHIARKLQYNVNCFVPIYRKESDAIARYIMFEFDRDFLNTAAVKLLENAFEVCGYFVSRKSQRKNDETEIIVIQFEPYFYENGRYTIPEQLYHITLRQSANRIRREGFVISHKSKIFNYPLRNFFFTSYNMTLMKSVMYRSKKCKKELQDNNPVTIFEIDSKKARTHFYSDPIYKDFDAVYCYDNLEPNVITKQTNTEI